MNNIYEINIIKYFNNKFDMFKFSRNYSDKYIYFNLTYINYSFSLKYNLVKVVYRIGFYTKNNIFISPSDLALYYNLHMICFSTNLKENISVESLPNIYQNS